MLNLSLNEEAIFKVACRITADDARAEYLQQVCGSDPELRCRVERLLLAYFQQPTFLESSRTEFEFDGDFTPSPERVGSTLGPYKILEKIAEGGMGVVYVAEQSEPIRRKVALKVIRPGMAGKNVVARFEAERQALAMMNHPNIARVFDGGATDEQLPYFVMELVQGLPITEYCDQQRLTIRERLELFLDVCHAVQHAHQKGIIHRDLKPSNVLVAEIDAKAVAKVIDFGVAKAIHQPLTERSIHTQFSQMIGTPLYMSPEQAGLGVIDVDTRSDVYSLGVMLYEILTGDTPFSRQALQTATFDEMRRIIREQEPRHLSAMISTMEAKGQSTIANNRGIDSRKLRDSLHGELDWIVMKALEKDRSRRYESASALADDIERYFHDKPIEACPPSIGYRTRKFAKRNKTLLTTGAFVCVALMAATGMSVWFAVDALDARAKAIAERNVSRQSYSVASNAIDRLLMQLSNDRLARVPEIGDIRQRAMQDAVELFSGLIELDSTNSSARLQRGKAYESLSSPERALKDYLKAVSLDPQNDRAHHALATFFNTVTDPNYRDYERALDHSSMAIAIDPTSVDYRLTRALIVGLRFNYDRSLHYFDEALQLDDARADIYEARADVAIDRGHASAALADVEKAMKLILPPGAKKGFGSDHSIEGELNRHRGRALMGMGRFQEALASFDKAVECDPYSHYVYYYRLSCFLQLARYQEALDDANSALRLEPGYHFTYKRRALCYFHLGHFSDALADLAKSLELAPKDTSAIWWIHPTLVAACPDRDFQLGLLQLADLALEVNEGSASALSVRGVLLSALGDKERALADIDKALELDPNNGLLCNIIAWHFATCFDADPKLSKRAVELAEKAASLKPGATTWNTLGVARYRVENFEGAIESLEKAEELSPGQYSAHNGLFLAMAHAKLGQKVEAQRWYEKAVAWIDAHGADDELQRFRSEADQLLESLDTLPPPSGERQMGQTGEEDTRADQPQAQPERSSEPVLETAGADPS